MHKPSIGLFAQAPFSGTSPFRKFTIGINAGVMNPSVVLEVQIIMGGNLKGDQDDKYGVNRPVDKFQTDLHWAFSLSGIATFGNINFLSEKNKIVPYVGVGYGYLSYDTKIVLPGTTNEVDFVDNNSPDHPWFVPCISWSEV